MPAHRDFGRRSLTAPTNARALADDFKPDTLAAGKMVYSKSKNMSEGKFMKPPDEQPKPDPPKRKPLLPLKRQSPFQYETNEIELPPWLQETQILQPSTSPGRSASVKFDLPKEKSARKKRRRNATLYDAVAGMNFR